MTDWIFADRPEIFRIDDGVESVRDKRANDVASERAVEGEGKIV
jgi:hypothetical protein